MRLQDSGVNVDLLVFTHSSEKFGAALQKEMQRGAITSVIAAARR
jgi:hypothetical protein